MVPPTTRSSPVFVTRLILIGAFFIVLLWGWQTTLSGQANVVGHISAMPSGSLIGAWTIGGVNFVSTGSTVFNQDKGAFAVGVCAEVEYVGSAQPFTASKIASKNANDCSNVTSTPSGTTTPATGTPGTTTPSVTPSPDNEQEVYGLVEQMPASGLIGTWLVKGVSYIAPVGAEFKQRNGPLMVGACVKIHYAANTTPFVVREIATEPLSLCNGSTTTPSVTPSATVTGTPGAERELYGLLQSFPTSLRGNWNIGGMTFVAGATTEFKQERGQFAVGGTVKVHFSIDNNGINQAREIETKVANERGSDDNGNGLIEGAEGHAFAPIDSFPAALTGDWRIGGVAYLAISSTVFAQNDGIFAVGAKGKVEYFVAADGKRLARKIETTSDSGGSTDPTHFKLFGFVKGMPANGFVGQWLVDNIAFVSDGNSQFKSNNGLLGLGAYVAVEYSIQNGHNQVHEIETHVPPGAGENFALGRIDDKGGALQAAAVQTTIWTIGGIQYTIMPATALHAGQSGLEVGKTALVNSYAAPDGSQVATQIRGVTMTNGVYLPLVRK